MTYTHVAFADESNWNQGRFRAIALVTAEVEHARVFHKDLDSVRQKHGKTEFKWTKVKERYGKDLVDFFFARHDRMRVDVLIWDMRDSRHAGVLGRDDKANFARMYYHLLHTTLKRRWPDGARWLICPDEQEGFDWETTEQCLGWKSWAAESDLLTNCGALPAFREYYNITEIRKVKSTECLLVQLADLFAGLACYSYNQFPKYQQWKSSGSTSLFDGSDFATAQEKINSRDRERLPIVHLVWQEAGRRKFKVSLDSTNGLYTHDPKHPLNFWLYQPQRAQDKAPTKQKS